MLEDRYSKAIIRDIVLKLLLIAMTIFAIISAVIVVIIWTKNTNNNLNIANGIAIEMYIASMLITFIVLFKWCKPIQSDEQNSTCIVFSIAWLTIPIGLIIEVLCKIDEKFGKNGRCYEIWIYLAPIVAVVFVLIYVSTCCRKNGIKLKQISDCVFIFCGTYIFLVNFYYIILNGKNSLLETASAFVAFSLVIISGIKVWTFWTHNEEIKLFGKSTTVVKQNIRKIERFVSKNNQLSRKWIRLVFWMRMPLVLKTIDCDYDENDKSTNKKLYTDWIITHEKSFKKICDDNKCTIYKLAECLWNINSSLTIKSEIRGKNDTSLRIGSKMENIFYGKIKISVKELIGVLYEEAKIELDEKEKIVTPWKKLIEK